MKQCKACKSEIDAKATKCAKCGADQRNWFRKHPILTVILALFVIGMIGSANGSKSTTTTQSGNSENPQVTQQPAETVSAIDAKVLVAEYDKNKLAAQDKYTGKLVKTTAYIKNISSDILGSYFLSLNPSSDQYYFGTSIQCYFANKDQLTSLENGQMITVQGKMQDMSIGIVQMKECSVVK
jgi:hypothetical protein